MYIPEEFYEQICRVMPIPCVDILVKDQSGRILLLKRKYEPMKDQWWFPGGRVFFNETRQQAVIRKLKEECNLTPLTINEIGTFDIFLDIPIKNLTSHAITTLFRVLVEKGSGQKIDDQSLSAEWRFPGEWMELNLHDFVSKQICNEKSDVESEYSKT
jgi:colanic acid biosynthesis protein WcaH